MSPSKGQGHPIKNVKTEATRAHCDTQEAILVQRDKTVKKQPLPRHHHYHHFQQLYQNNNRQK